jgi:hypothetical protein
MDFLIMAVAVQLVASTVGSMFHVLHWDLLAANLWGTSSFRMQATGDTTTAIHRRQGLKDVFTISTIPT